MILMSSIISKKNIFFSFIVTIFTSLIIYRTLKPINFNNTNLITLENIKKSNISQNHIVLENNNILLTVNLNGGFINNIFFKKYNKIFLPSSNQKKDEIYDSYNAFQTGWFSDENNMTPHRIKTKWKVLENTKNKLVVVVKIHEIEFKKIFILEDEKLIIEDVFDNIHNSTDVVLYNYGGFSLIPDTKEKEELNFITYNNKNNLITINNKPAKKIKKENLVKDNNSWFGIEDNYFLLFAKTNDGEIYSDIDLNKNKLYYSSNDIYTPNKKYVLYILPKDESILNKHKISNILSYGFSGPMRYILDLFKIFTYLLHKTFVYTNNYTKNPLLGLFTIILIILFINCFFIFLIEKEKIKLKIHKDEKNFIENNYKEDQQNHLKYFYQKYNIKIGRLFYLSILTTISWALLNKTISLCFCFKDLGFLHIKDLMSPDPYSILNLYGLLKINIPAFISNNISTDILSLVAIFIYNNNNRINSNTFNSSEKNINFDNNSIFKTIQLFLLVTFAKTLSSAFIISLIFILIMSNIFQKITENYFLKKYNI
jgi:hypothetical protein